MNTDENKEAFDSIINKNCSMLILDKIPSQCSINKQQYYAHQEDLFWDIIFRVLNITLSTEEIEKLNYQNKIQILLDNKIALWYVLRQQQNHSLVYNDFELFFSKYPNIKTIFFNGNNAMALFNKKYKSVVEKLHIKGIALPPTRQNHHQNIFKRLSVWQKMIPSNLF